MSFNLAIAPLQFLKIFFEIIMTEYVNTLEKTSNEEKTSYTNYLQCKADAKEEEKDVIGQFDPGLQGPSPDELDGPLLQRQVLAINDSVEAMKKSCALEGCSLLVNTGIGDNECFVLNLAVHCSQDIIGSMLEDIGTIRLIRKTIAKARFLTAFIYGQTNLLAMTRQFTSQWDLVHVGISYYTTCLLNLKSIYDKRIELKGMFISKEWEDSKWSNGAVDKKFYNLVVRNEFWHGVLYTINSFEPLVDVLRRMGGSRPSMGYIYGELAKAKREIALRFENKEEHYLPIWDEIDFRLNDALKTPLHLAGFYLNPFFTINPKMILKMPESSEVTFSLSVVSWWELHGVAAKELSTMAMRLLRLTCGSLAYEESWIKKLHNKKPCWVKRKQFEDSMFVTVNRRIQGKAQMTNRDPVLAYIPDEDEPFEWLVGRSRDCAEQDVDEDSDEEPPRRSGNKQTSSSASYSKRVKRPRSGKGFLWDNKHEGSDGEVSL
ncbi:unnamed protein product [Miscanthus lutarioriparius]|uniref:Uncharacterized protein n=1 Tax=Miscanthus lutarioriparius TaxID=422564 RepID=A0A811MYG1_9POAL|nr:unnamed protein product [Miscanthus lutarioriparius]